MSGLSDRTILVTGANGFIGAAVCKEAIARGAAVHAAVRATRAPAIPGSTTFAVGEVGPQTDWSQALVECDTVIHLAGRAHVLREHSADPMAEFRRINVAGTLALASQAARAGIQRFIFISSIGVNGAQTQGQPLTADAPPAPHSPYALSKHEAEQGLWNTARQTGMPTLVIRPPLVYGPGAPGNFATLLRWLRTGLPLPLGAIQNQRSLVALDNLVDLVLTCVDYAAAPGHTYLVSDGEDLSTTELLRRLAQAMHRPARLWPVPQPWLKRAAQLLGRNAAYQSLCGSLQVDMSGTQRQLDWRPPVSVNEGLRRAVQECKP